jgi:hypothetical protein
VNIAGIYTIRDSPHPHYWEVVFEWEDQLSKSLDVPLIPVGKEYDNIYRPNLFRKVLNRLDAYKAFDRLFYFPNAHYIAFHIGPPGAYSFYTRKNVIPIIIDFWKHENLSRFASIFSIAPAVFVTSMQVYQFLKGADIKLNLQHVPLSLPDKYVHHDLSNLRDIDIIQIGRSHSRLNAYMQEFLREFPKVNYVSARKVDSHLEFHSTVWGSMGKFDSREGFISLLKRSRISLVSAPGLDDDYERTGGFSPVTPRFLESAACGCRLIGIFQNNEDFTYYGVNEICQNVKDFDEFRTLVQQYLLADTLPEYSHFLSRHATSNVARQLLTKLENSHE